MIYEATAGTLFLFSSKQLLCIVGESHTAPHNMVYLLLIECIFGGDNDTSCGLDSNNIPSFLLISFEHKLSRIIIILYPVSRSIN
jgi:hypothetical protein